MRGPAQRFVQPLGVEAAAAPVAVEAATHSSTKRFALGIFEDEDVLLHAIDNVRAAGVKIYEVFSPYLTKYLGPMQLDVD